MNTSTIAKNYGNLRAEERFRLIMAASGRGDETERSRLKDSGRQITLNLPDHWPYAQAFSELANLVFPELLDLAARFSQHCHELALEDTGEEEPAEEDENAINEETVSDRAKWRQILDLVLADGWLLTTNSAGWELFCEKLSVPPYLVWEGLPGLERLQDTLVRAEKLSFDADSIVEWLNSVRLPDTSEIKENPMTAERIASSHERFFRARVQHWNRYQAAAGKRV